MTSVTVVDTGLSNIQSIVGALEQCGATPVVSVSPEELGRATHIVVPGVGAFPKAMANLHRNGLVDPLRRRAAAGIPFLGICLGMQLLGTRGEEMGGAEGLDLIPGEVTMLDPAPGERLPHVGWNQVVATRTSPLLARVDPERDFYFVHSWTLRPFNLGDVVAVTPFASEFVSVVSRDNIFGVQFHPEKSQAAGFQILRNFLAL